MTTTQHAYDAGTPSERGEGVCFDGGEREVPSVALFSLFLGEIDLPLSTCILSSRSRSPGDDVGDSVAIGGRAMGPDVVFTCEEEDVECPVPTGLGCGGKTGWRGGGLAG